MIASEAHAAWRALPIASPEAVTDGKTFLVISPHPDDESLGMGGIIAASRATGVDVRVVVLSDGAQSHPGSRLYPRDRLVALRRAETSTAAEALGLVAGSVTHFDLPDAAVPLEGADFEAALSRLAAIVDRSDAAAAFVTWGHDPHCDHEAAAAMARRLRELRPALKVWCYPIWGWHLEASDEIDIPAPHGYRIDITPWLGAKRAAIAAHASQMTDLIDDDPEGFRFTPDKLAPFMAPFETVFEMPA